MAPSPTPNRSPGSAGQRSPGMRSQRVPAKSTLSPKSLTALSRTPPKPSLLRPSTSPSKSNKSPAPPPTHQHPSTSKFYNTTTPPLNNFTIHYSSGAIAFEHGPNSPKKLPKLPSVPKEMTLSPEMVGGLEDMTASFHNLYTNASTHIPLSTTSLPIVLRDLASLDAGRVSPTADKPEPLIWTETSLISQSAMSSTALTTAVTADLLSPETANMLSYALHKIDIADATRALIVDAETPLDRQHAGKKTRRQDHSFLPATTVTTNPDGTVNPSWAPAAPSISRRMAGIPVDPENQTAKLKKGMPGNTYATKLWDYGNARVDGGAIDTEVVLRLDAKNSATEQVMAERRAGLKKFVKVVEEKGSPVRPREFEEQEEEGGNTTTIQRLMPCESFSCEELFLSNYATDLGRYSSFSVWASTALAEVGALIGSKTLPHCVLVGMCGHMLVEMEPVLVRSYGEKVKTVIDNVLGSVYKLRDGEGKVSCGNARKILERNDEEEKSSEFRLGANAAGYKDRFKVFLTLPTFYDEIRFLWGKLKREIVVRPPCHRKMQQMRAERISETRAIDRACTFWTKGILLCMFLAWKLDTNMEHDRDKRGKYMLMMVQLKVGDVFKAWLKVHREEVAFKEIKSVGTSKVQVEESKADIKRLNFENSGKVRTVNDARSAAEKVKRLVVEQKDIYEMPARQTPILKRIVIKFNDIYKRFADFQDKEHQYHIDEQFRKGEDTIRLDPLYKWKAVGETEETYNRGRRPSLGGRPSDLLDAGVFETETDCEEDDEEVIRKWKPGTFASVEKTPAFQPFQTRAGRRTMRFINNALREFRFDNNLPKSKMCRNWKDLEDGKLTEMLMLHFTKKSVDSDVQLHEGIVKMADNEDKMKEKWVEGVSEEFYTANPQIMKTWSLLKYAEDTFNGACRHIDQQHLTGMERPKTQAEVTKLEARMACLALRTKDTGIVVHIMSQYMGQRIHVLHVHEPMTFAFLAECFTLFFPKCQDMLDEKKMLQKRLDRTLGDNRRILREIFDEMANGPDQYEHAALLGISARIKTVTATFKASDDFLLGNWKRCLMDRLRYREHVPELVRLVWQSLCTTVLSRKVRTEEDLDDGTYTTVDKEQLRSEFKRNGVINEEVLDEECAAIKAVLKNRIRDLKRIFGFYAAAGDGGPATSMDNGEFWKLVKDCKLQVDTFKGEKRREKLPSVRVDLIFQACNIDYTQVGADRIASDDGEMDATEWVEGLVRLSVYARTKGSVASRLDKLMNVEILPNACSLDIDVFRERLNGDRVKDTLQMHKMNMKPIFVAYAADDDTDGGVESLESMNSNELVTYGRELDLVGAPPSLSERGIKTLFAYCQQEEEETEEDEGETQSDSEQVYSEFMETNAAIGSQMRPDPYNVLEIRIDQFLCEMIHPKAIVHARFRGKGLKPVERLKALWIEKMLREKEKEEADG